MSYVDEDDQVDAMVDNLTIDEPALDSNTLTTELQQFDDIDSVSELEEVEEQSDEMMTIEAIESEDAEEVTVKTTIDEKPKTPIPPLRPLTIAPKPTKIPVSFKPVAGQQLLLVQGSGAGQQIKLLSTTQGLNLSNLSIAKPITIKQSPKTISLMQPKKMVMKKVIPKSLTKAFEGKPGQQIVVLQKSDNQMKLLPTTTPTKTLTLSQAQQMGIISGTKIVPHSTKQIVVNKAGQSKAIKIIPQLRSPTKILPAPQTTLGTTTTTVGSKTPQRIYLKQASVTPTTHILPGQIIQVPSNSAGQLHQINIPGKGMQYIKFITTTQSLDTQTSVSAAGTKVTTAKITSASTPQSAKPIIKIAKPLTPSATLRAIPSSSGAIVFNRGNITPGKLQPTRQSIQTMSKQVSGGGDAVVPTTPQSPEITVESNGIKARKPCNCAKSQCLKLYCDCFANGEFCYMCNCMNCYNNLDNEEHRQRAIKNCLERNPNAFRPKIGKGKDTGEATVRKHTKGCNCKRSGCLKNYCECYEAKIACSSNCKCMGCKNVENADSMTGSRTSLLSDTSFSNSPQAARKLPVDASFRARKSTTARQPFNFINNVVIEATGQCLITMAKNAEEQVQPEEVTKKEIIEEFGRCLKEIIDCSSGKNVQVK